MVEKSPGQVALVVLLEGVLLLQEPEEDHGLVEDGLDLGVAQTPHPLLQLVVDEQGQVLRRARVEVEKVLKVAGDGQLEESVAGKGDAQEPIVLVL